jgi:hypothetical protein
MSPEPVAIITNTPVSSISGLDSGDPSREMIELRVQLDRERRLRMHLEDQVSQFRSRSKLAQAVTLQACIWVVPGLNLGPYTDYTDRLFVIFFQLLGQVLQPYHKMGPTTSSTSFAIHYSLSSNHSALCSLTYRQHH